MERSSSRKIKLEGAELRAIAGKYLTFRLGTEEYGLEILKVQEIIGLMPITKVPKLPSFIRGILNLRGKLIPVIEMRSRFGMESVPDHSRTCIVVIQVGTLNSTMTMGIVVDGVNEVVYIAEDQLSSPPILGREIEMEYVLGLAKLPSRVILLLDIDRILTGSEANELKTEIIDKK